MTPAQILAVAFNIFAVGVLLVLIFGKKDFVPKNYKKFLVATTAIYLSGTVLITVLLFLASLIQLQFAIISELCILFIYVFDSYMIVRMGNNVEALREANSNLEEEN